MARVVQCLEDETAGEGAVSDDRSGEAVLAPQSCRLGKAQGGGKTRAAVTRAEGVVFRFLAAGEAGNAVFFPQGGESLTSAGEDLMHVALMTRIVNDLVPRKIHDPNQGGGDLHDAQIGCKMSAVFGHVLDQKGAQVGAVALCPCKTQGANSLGGVGGSHLPIP